jgi:hypothetical protein
LIINELKKTWKKAIVAYFKVLSHHLPGVYLDKMRKRETYIKIDDLLTRFEP